MTPRKRFGQHFLIDESVASDIVRHANLSDRDTVVEIGAGTGILTSRLADISGRVIAIEIDKRLCNNLSKKLSSYNNISIVNANAMRFNYGEISERFKVVSNLPYYISKPMTARLMENRKKITGMVLMFQREVADRITAEPGTKKYGNFSIIVQYNADVLKLMDVGREAFKPAPEVDSSVIRITPRNEPVVKVTDEKLFFKIVKTAFSNRRKTIRNNLKALGLSGEALEKIFKETHIEPSGRGEVLSISDFANISNFISLQKTAL